MNNMKSTRIGMAIFILLFMGVVGLAIILSSIDQQTVTTTSLYTATVSEVKISNPGNDPYVEINIEEYTTDLLISTTICQNLNMDRLDLLVPGQKISFRIEKIKAEQLDESRFVDIIALRTNAAVLFSLQDYNQYMHKAAFPARIASTLLALFFLVGALFCGFKIKKNSANT